MMASYSLKAVSEKLLRANGAFIGSQKNYFGFIGPQVGVKLVGKSVFPKNARTNNKINFGRSQ